MIEIEIVKVNNVPKYLGNAEFCIFTFYLLFYTKLV